MVNEKLLLFLEFKNIPTSGPEVRPHFAPVA